MFLSSVFKIAWNSLKVHRLRSFLTILGIVIGIMSVVVVFSAGEGIKSLVTNQIASWGSDALEVEVKVPNSAQNSSENGSNMAQGVTITTLKIDDMEAIKKQSNVVDAYAFVMGQGIVSYREESDIMGLWGVSASYLNVDSSKVQDGRFFTEEEDKGQDRVIVIGPDAKKKFFGDGDALGKSLRIDKSNFKVIGIMKPRGTYMFMNMDENIYLPVRTLQKVIMNVDHIQFIMAKLKDKSLGNLTAGDITLLMRDRHEITDPIKDDFAVTTMAEAMKMVDTVLGAVTLLLAAIAAISLIVGGVGIMNIMFVSVTERINEIGLRKAVGAKPRSIMTQFLWEAVILTFAGGIIGILVGISVSYLVAVIARSQGLEWSFIVQPSGLILAVGVSVTIGVVFGFYPAKRAAQLDPIEALRYEY
jgi:putative ABC transport system permease protein